MAGFVANTIIDQVTGEVGAQLKTSLHQAGLGDHQLKMIESISGVYEYSQAEQSLNFMMEQTPLAQFEEGRLATYMHTESIEFLDERGQAGFEHETIRIGSEKFTVYADASGLAYGQSSDVRVHGDVSKLDKEEREQFEDFKDKVQGQAEAEMEVYTTPEGSQIYRSNFEKYLEENFAREFSAQQQSASLELNGPLTIGGGDAGFIQTASVDGLKVTAGAMKLDSASTPANFTHAPQLMVG